MLLHLHHYWQEGEFCLSFSLCVDNSPTSIRLSGASYSCNFLTAHFNYYSRVIQNIRLCLKCIGIFPCLHICLQQILLKAIIIVVEAGGEVLNLDLFLTFWAP